MGKLQRYTVYDLMADKGVFDANPANAGAQDPVDGTSIYRGPVRFPMMFYHPKGKTRITQPGVVEMVNGEKMKVGEQKELVFELARTPEEEKRLRGMGWHDHPAKAIQAGGGEAPAISPASEIDDLREQLRRVQEQLVLAEERKGFQPKVQEEDEDDNPLGRPMTEEQKKAFGIV